MKQTQQIVATILAGGMLCTAQAENNSLWRAGAGYRNLFNVDVSFESRRASPAANNPSTTGRSYRDGFVGTDDTGNALDLTTFFGFQRESQVAGDSIGFRNARSRSIGSDNDQWGNGFEFTLARELTSARNVRVGIEGAFNYAYIDANSGSRALSVDAFPLGGIIPPTAPYSGPQTSGPGVPVLGATPTTVPLSVSSRWNANIFGFRLGPYFDFPITECWSFQLGGGLAVGFVDSETRFEERAPAPFGGFGRTQKGDDLQTLVGGYFSGQVNYQINDQWGVFTGMQFTGMQNYKQDVGDKRVKVDLSSSLSFILGVQFRF